MLLSHTCFLISDEDIYYYYLFTAEIMYYIQKYNLLNKSRNVSNNLKNQIWKTDLIKLCVL